MIRTASRQPTRRDPRMRNANPAPAKMGVAELTVQLEKVDVKSRTSVRQTGVRSPGLRNMSTSASMPGRALQSGQSTASRQGE